MDYSFSVPLQNTLRLLSSVFAPSATKPNTTVTKSVAKPLFRPETAHIGWQPKTYDVGPTKHIIYDIPPKTGKPCADVLFMTGCGSDPLLFARKINNELSKHGFRTFAAKQVHINENPENIPENMRYAEWLLLNARSPLNAERTPDTPLFVITASSTTLLMDRLGLDADAARQIGKTVTHFFNDSAFYDTAKSYIIHKGQDASPAERFLRATASGAYGKYAQWNSNHVLGKAWPDRLFLKLRGAESSLLTSTSELVENVTHGEGYTYSRLIGRPFVRELEKIRDEHPGHPIFGIRSTSYVGANDPAASARTSGYVDFLKGENATRIHTLGGHITIKEDHDVMRHVRSVMTAYVEGRDVTPLLPHPEEPRKLSEFAHKPVSTPLPT